MEGGEDDKEGGVVEVGRVWMAERVKMGEKGEGCGGLGVW